MNHDPDAASKSLALGGGCHWCTEAVFQSLHGVWDVDQGWISTPMLAGESEGVVIHFDPGTIPLRELVKVHLHTHASMSNHSMRDRYRSACYARSDEEGEELSAILGDLAEELPRPLVTRVLPFGAFRRSREAIRNYYRTDPRRPFCVAHIEPKLRSVREAFPEWMTARGRGTSFRL